VHVPPLASYRPSKSDKRPSAKMTRILRRMHRPQKGHGRHHGDDNESERSGEETSL
jgi:hypothetical protein